MRPILIALLLCILTAPASAGGDTARTAKGWDLYGAALAKKGRFQPVERVTAPTAEGKTLRAEGTIAEVCQAKGCWMNVGAGDAPLRVEFKDYGFFVPSTAAGKRVRMEGVVVERTLGEAEREHLRAESESGAEVPAKMLVFVASGVQIEGGGAIPEAQQRRIEGRRPAAGEVDTP